MGKAVARRSKSAIVAEVFEDPISREFMLRKFGVLLRRELTLMCSEKTKSILNSQCMLDLQEFSWKKFLSKMASNAPLLLSILQSCTYTRKRRLNQNAAIGMCSAILLKLRYSKMSMVQRIVSFILYAGNSGKQVHHIFTK